MRASSECSDLIIVYGSVADKDVDAALRLLPENASYVFTRAQGKRALDAGEVRDRYLKLCEETGRNKENVFVADTVAEAMDIAFRLNENFKTVDSCAHPLIYVGGSTYVVSEALHIRLIQEPPNHT